MACFQMVAVRIRLHRIVINRVPPQTVNIRDLSPTGKSKAIDCGTYIERRK